MENTELEQEIERFVKVQKRGRVSNALRALVEDLTKPSEKLRSLSVDSPEEIKRHLIQEGKLKLTNSSLRSLADALISKRNDAKHDNVLNARTEIVYKHLCTLHQPTRGEKKSGSPKEEQMVREEKERKVWEGVKAIRRGDPFPALDNTYNKAEIDDKYKGLALLLKSEKHAELPTLKLAFALFGIIPSAFASCYLKDNEQFRPKTSIEGMFAGRGTIWILAITILIISSAFIAYQVSQRKDSDNWRPRISSSTLFSSPSPITSPSIPVTDTIIVSVEDVVFSNSVIGVDTVAIDTIWIRLKISNLSSANTYFPDGVFLKKLESGTIAGVLDTGNGGQYNVSPKILIDINPNQFNVVEWVIENSSKENLPPRTEMYTLLEIRGDRRATTPVAFTFELIFEFHKGGNNYYAKPPRSFKIAFK